MKITIVRNDLEYVKVMQKYFCVEKKKKGVVRMWCIIIDQMIWVEWRMAQL